MTWVRIDDGYYLHPKVIAAGPLAMAMQVAALCYCNRNLTDGFVPWAAAQTLLSWQFLGAQDERGRPRFTIAATSGIRGEDVTSKFVIDLLVDAAIWEETDTGYQIHDYLDYQPARSDVLAERERVKKWRDTHRSTTGAFMSDGKEPSEPHLPYNERTRTEPVTYNRPVPVPVPVPEPLEIGGKTDVVTIAFSDKTAAVIPKLVPKLKPKQPKDPTVYSEHVLFVCQCFDRVPGRLTAFHRQLIDETVALTGPTAFQDAVRWKAGNDGKYNLNAIITTAKKIAKEGGSRVKPADKTNPPALILPGRMFCPLCSIEIRNGRTFDGQHQACEESDRFLQWETEAFSVLEERWAVTAAELEAIKVKGDPFQWLATQKSS